MLRRGQSGGHAGGGRAGARPAVRQASVRSHFLAETAVGMARVLGGDAAAGAEALHRSVALADGSPELKDDLELLPWLTLGPIFLQEGRRGAARRSRRRSRPRGNVPRSAGCRSCCSCSRVTRPRPIAGRSPRPSTRRRSVWRARPISAPISASASPASRGSRPGAVERRDPRAGRRGDPAVRRNRNAAIRGVGSRRAWRARARSR